MTFWKLIFFSCECWIFFVVFLAIAVSMIKSILLSIDFIKTNETIKQHGEELKEVE